MKIYQRLVAIEPLTSLPAIKQVTFNASGGWLSGFLKRYTYRNLKIKGEVASAD